ncbi:MAG: protein-tyrosine-phosphatase [Flavobacteriales bacterium]|nr:protein-tyrosine-phosphatase [Flavobacteriales bacterium]
MFQKIKSNIQSFNIVGISEERKQVLRPLVQFIQSKIESKQAIELNFICTHNSRRSLLSQVWAKTLAEHFSIPNVSCYSGGTESTALFPKVAETLEKSGFKIEIHLKGTNPIYQIRYATDKDPILAFSKKFDDASNPQSSFVAILTCSSADEACPFIAGAEQRIPITFEDPKISDGTPQQDQVYFERSLEIATEIYFVFSQLNTPA